MIRHEIEIREKIAQITADNKDLLDINLATTAEPAQMSLKRALVIINLNLLHWVVKEERPKFQCDVKPN